MSDAKFIEGLIVKAPNENAPEYVKAKLSIKRVELIDWLLAQTGDWINADVKVSQNGKWYAAVDDWKPQGAAPFVSGRGHKPAGKPQAARGVAATAGTADTFDDPEIPF